MVQLEEFRLLSGLLLSALLTNLALPPKPVIQRTRPSCRTSRVPPSTILPPSTAGDDSATRDCPRPGASVATIEQHVGERRPHHHPIKRHVKSPSTNLSTPHTTTTHARSELPASGTRHLFFSSSFPPWLLPCFQFRTASSRNPVPPPRSRLIGRPQKAC